MTVHVYNTYIPTNVFFLNQQLLTFKHIMKKSIVNIKPTMGSKFTICVIDK